MSIVPPIILVEGFDLVIHPSVEKAEQWIEPWWVRKNEGTVYDASGQSLKAIVDEKSGKVRLTKPAASVSDEQELRTSLVGHLLKTAKSSDESYLQGLPLHQLIRMAVTT